MNGNEWTWREWCNANPCRQARGQTVFLVQIQAERISELFSGEQLLLPAGCSAREKSLRCDLVWQNLQMAGELRNEERKVTIERKCEIEHCEFYGTLLYPLRCLSGLAWPVVVRSEEGGKMLWIIKQRPRQWEWMALFATFKGYAALEAGRWKRKGGTFHSRLQYRIKVQLCWYHTNWSTLCTDMTRLHYFAHFENNFLSCPALPPVGI